jgi:hypothetical protein
VGAALIAGLLALGVTTAIAASHHTAKPKVKPFKPFTVTCTTNVGIMIAQGDTGVVPPADQGSEYGPASCGGKLGQGIQSDTFTVPDSGDSVANWTMHFDTGTVHGAYDLTPQEGSFTGANFTEVDYTGTMTLTGGTGVFRGAVGHGTMVCKTLDGIHTSCVDTVKVTKLPSATKTTTAK